MFCIPTVGPAKPSKCLLLLLFLVSYLPTLNNTLLASLTLREQQQQQPQPLETELEVATAAAPQQNSSRHSSQSDLPMLLCCLSCICRCLLTFSLFRASSSSASRYLLFEGFIMAAAGRTHFLSNTHCYLIPQVLPMMHGI